MPTPPDDILLNKAAIIERCIRRIAEESQACLCREVLLFVLLSCRGPREAVDFGEISITVNL